ncbi:MAG: LicD family protein [Lachnospiraceae bacterium]|nr:LicD family protein [Lachnospiraceae bacterium]
MKDNITKLREVQLDLLRAFSSVCKEHDLRYYAFFGTLLGIMRGEGYLPWDDDVDIAMPMEDYAKLCGNPDWFDKKKYTLQTPISCGNPAFAKLRKNGTTAFRADFITELKAGGHHGICIDIIPLSDIPGMDSYNTPTVSSPNKKDKVYLKDWFEPAGTGIFEGLELRIPAKSRKVLTESYETWAWPAGARECCPTYWFFDTEKGYDDYVRRFTGMIPAMEGKKVFLFGAADSLRIWLERFDKKQDVICTFDNDPGKWGSLSYGVEVKNPEELPGLLKKEKDSIVIIVSLWHLDIGRQLESMGINDYYIYLDDYYDEKIGNKVVRREDLPRGDKTIPHWDA